MAITMTLSNHYKFSLMKKLINLDTDTLKIILMNDAFVFDKDAHATLSDVTADQLPTGNGYTQDSKMLENTVVTEDDVNDKGKMTCDDVLWTASGGSIGPTGAAIIYDGTVADDVVVGCADYGADYTMPDGSAFEITDIEIDVT